MVVPVLDYVRLCSNSSDFVFTPDEKRLKCNHKNFGLGVTRILSKDGPDCPHACDQYTLNISLNNSHFERTDDLLPVCVSPKQSNVLRNG